jgi:3-dehydrotetronate 4-kinase
MSRLLLGCIADDFTGATDLANNLVRSGMRVIETIGVPGPLEPANAPLEADAIVIALKSRTIPRSDAVAQSLHACRWLRKHGAQQIYFKICSTFDSTPAGNIGPVIESLMGELSCKFSIATPAFPDTGRTVFNGYLFVGDMLLSESGMRNHPLTPMTDANLVRVLQAQLSHSEGRKVGLISYRTVAESAESILRQIDELRSEGFDLAIVDAISNDDLIRLGAALRDAPLVTAASGLALGLPLSWGFHPTQESSRLPQAEGYKAIVSGSCSTATRGQVLRFVRNGGAAHALEPERLAANLEEEMAEALAWAASCWRENPALPLLIYSTADPTAVEAAQSKLGVEQAGAIVEHALSLVAQGLVECGAGMLIVAGGETSGACVQALCIRRLQIGPQIDAGVPWCYAAIPLRHSGLHVALKSGNFGSEDFFSKAFDLLTPTL